MVDQTVLPTSGVDVEEIQAKAGFEDEVVERLVEELTTRDKLTSKRGWHKSPRVKAAVEKIDAVVDEIRAAAEADGVDFAEAFGAAEGIVKFRRIFTAFNTAQHNGDIQHGLLLAVLNGNAVVLGLENQPESYKALRQAVLEDVSEKAAEEEVAHIVAENEVERPEEAGVHFFFFRGNKRYFRFPGHEKKSIRDLINAFHSNRIRVREEAQEAREEEHALIDGAELYVDELKLWLAGDDVAEGMSGSFGFGSVELNSGRKLHGAVGGQITGDTIVVTKATRDFEAYLTDKEDNSFVGKEFARGSMPGRVYGVLASAQGPKEYTADPPSTESATTEFGQALSEALAGDSESETDNA